MKALSAERRQQVIRSIPLLLMLLPAVAAAMNSPRVPVGRPLAAHRKTDSLALLQYAVNLGEVPATGAIPAYFEFWNQGDRPLRIHKLEASCGCLDPKLLHGKDEYLPGETGQFAVSVKTANETPGPKEYTIRILYDDADERQEQVVTFRLQVPARKVSVHPPELVFYQLHGAPDSAVVRVVDERGGDLKVLRTAVSSAHIQARIGDVHSAEGERTDIPIHLDIAGDVPAPREMSLLTIHTNDSEYPVIRVPIMLFGSPQKVQPASGASAARPEASAPVRSASMELPKPRHEKPDARFEGDSIERDKNHQATTEDASAARTTDPKNHQAEP